MAATSFGHTGGLNCQPPLHGRPHWAAPTQKGGKGARQYPECAVG